MDHLLLCASSSNEVREVKVSPRSKSSDPMNNCLRSDETSMGAVSIEVAAELFARRELFRLGLRFRRLFPRRSCAAAAIDARDGATFIEAADEVRGMLRPSRPSIGGSSFAIFGFRSSPFVKVNDVLRLGIFFSPSDSSSSLESLS